MPKIDVNALPARVWDTKTFSCSFGEGQVLEFTVRAATALEVLSMPTAEKRADEILGGAILVDGQAVALKGDSAQILTIVFENQVGGPEDRYTLEELVIAAAKIPQLSATLAEAFTWIVEGVNAEVPPASTEQGSELSPGALEGS